MELTTKHCRPCEGSEPPLSATAEDALLKECPEWSIDRSVIHKLHREIICDSFVDAMDLVNKIAYIAEEEQHHPEITIRFKTVEINLWTHAILGLSENDFILAVKIDEIMPVLEGTVAVFQS
jgi:4a-hydroxytetrahydrobiopterin dehydratase